MYFYRYYFIICLLHFTAIPMPFLPAQVQPANSDHEPTTDEDFGLHPWQRYIRGFRTEHHFSLITGLSKMRWDLSNVSDTLPKRPSDSGIVFRFRYHYHMKITYDFGFFVGTSAGITQVISSSENPIEAHLGQEYPGIFAGCVFNRSPNHRIWFGLERFLERYEDFELQLPSQKQNLALTMTTYDFSLGTDYFVLMPLAFSFEAHYRYSEHNRLQSKKNSINSLGIKFDREDFWLGFGLTFHML